MRYSPGCQAAWARFDPVTVIMGRFAPRAHLKLTLMRPADGRHVVYDADYVGTFLYGDVLNTARGCVTAAVVLTAPHTSPLSATTTCQSK